MNQAIDSEVTKMKVAVKSEPIEEVIGRSFYFRGLLPSDLKELKKNLRGVAEDVSGGSIFEHQGGYYSKQKGGWNAIKRVFKSKESRASEGKLLFDIVAEEGKAKQLFDGKVIIYTGGIDLCCMPSIIKTVLNLQNGLSEREYKLTANIGKLTATISSDLFIEYNSFDRKDKELEKALYSIIKEEAKSNLKCKIATRHKDRWQDRPYEEIQVRQWFGLGDKYKQIRARVNDLNKELKNRTFVILGKDHKVILNDEKTRRYKISITWSGGEEKISDEQCYVLYNVINRYFLGRLTLDSDLKEIKDYQGNTSATIAPGRDRRTAEIILYPAIANQLPDISVRSLESSIKGVLEETAKETKRKFVQPVAELPKATVKKPAYSKDIILVCLPDENGEPNYAKPIAVAGGSYAVLAALGLTPFTGGNDYAVAVLRYKDGNINKKEKPLVDDLEKHAKEGTEYTRTITIKTVQYIGNYPETFNVSAIPALISKKDMEGRNLQMSIVNVMRAAYSLKATGKLDVHHLPEEAGLQILPSNLAEKYMPS